MQKWSAGHIEGILRITWKNFHSHDDESKECQILSDSKWCMEITNEEEKNKPSTQSVMVVWEKRAAQDTV